MWWRWLPWLPVIGYHNTGVGEEQPLPLDTRHCRPPFIRNYIHHISRLADKLTPAWNGAKMEPRRVSRQVLEQPPQPSHNPLPPTCTPASAAGFQLQLWGLNALICSRGSRGALGFFQRLRLLSEGTVSVLPFVQQKLQPLITSVQPI